MDRETNAGATLSGGLQWRPADDGVNRGGVPRCRTRV
jgi:hypothetical protein